MTEKGAAGGRRGALRIVAGVALVAVAAAVVTERLRERSAAHTAFPTVEGRIAVPGLTPPTAAGSVIAAW